MTHSTGRCTSPQSQVKYQMCTVSPKIINAISKNTRIERNRAYRRRGLAAHSFNTEDLGGQFTLSVFELKPIDVDRSVVRGREISHFRTDHEGLRVTVESGRSEVPMVCLNRINSVLNMLSRAVPFRAQACTGDGVRDEVMLSQNEWRAME